MEKYIVMEFEEYNINVGMKSLERLKETIRSDLFDESILSDKANTPSIVKGCMSKLFSSIGNKLHKLVVLSSL